MDKVVNMALARHERQMTELDDKLFELIDWFCDERDMWRPEVAARVLQNVLNEVSGAAESGHESAADVMSAIRREFFPPLAPEPSPQLALEV